MPLDVAILIGNAIIIALILVGGFWIRNLVNQQLSAKDANISTLTSEISRLEKISAPNLVVQLEKMAQYVNSNGVPSALESPNGGLTKEEADLRVRQAFNVGIAAGSMNVVIGVFFALEKFLEKTDKAVDLTQISKEALSLARSLYGLQQEGIHSVEVVYRTQGDAQPPLNHAVEFRRLNRPKN